MSTLCGSKSLTPEEPDEAVERLVARGPDIDMSPEEELRARSEALEGAIQAAVAAGLPDSRVERLREVSGNRWIRYRHVWSFIIHKRHLRFFE